MTYTNIPPISYIFVGVTTAILSYVTWAELQEDKNEIPQEEEEEEVPQEEEKEIPQEEEKEIPQEEKEGQGLMGGKKRSTTKKKRNIKKKKQTKHTKLKSK